jgi:hypothetical protein
VDGHGQALYHLLQMPHSWRRRATIPIGRHHERASERQMGWNILWLQFEGALQRLSRLREKVAFF